MRRGGASAKRQIARNRGIRTANKGTWEVITVLFKNHSCLVVFTLITRSRGNPGRDACEEPANRLRGPLNNFQVDADDVDGEALRLRIMCKLSYNSQIIHSCILKSSLSSQLFSFSQLICPIFSLPSHLSQFASYSLLP